MKKIIAGGILLLVGAIIYLTIHTPAAKYSLTLGSWPISLGRLGTALNEMGGTQPTNFSIFLMILGLILILIGAFSDEIKYIINKLKDKK
jgi:hypothetical protein